MSIDPKHFPRRRSYRFMLRPEENAVLCEDLNIATDLICQAIEIEWNRARTKFRIVQYFKPGNFVGVDLGREKRTGQTLYFFKVIGNVEELNRRRFLYHAGIHWASGKARASARNDLLDALSAAKQAVRDKTYIPVIKGGGFDGNEEGNRKEAICRDGANVPAEQDADRGEDDSGVGRPAAQDEAPGDRGAGDGEHADTAGEG